MVKTIIIDGKEITLRCSGATYIKYKNAFHQDLFTELTKITKNVQEGNEELPEGSVEVLLKAAYIMAQQADGEKKDFEDWLDQFELVGALDSIQAVFEMLNSDKETLDDAKKNSDQPTEK